MKTKHCSHCLKETKVAYRIQEVKGGDWRFVCGKCCLVAKKGVYYVYGGTWKGKHHSTLGNSK